MEPIFNIFGSEDSIDCDIMVFVESLPSTEECKKLCQKYESELSFKLKTNKDINVNLAIVKNGTIIDCFKGTPDEVNNSIFYTYTCHIQMHPCQVTTLLERDIKLKFARAIRIILSFLSRTEDKDKVKKALKGNFQDKLVALWEIDISKLNDLGKNNQSLADFYKTVAFQAGQCLALINNKEVYRKSEIIKLYPRLKEALMRDSNCDKDSMEKVKRLLVNTIDWNFANEDLVEHTNWRKEN